jgi:intracellular sulfur oxidation DsrE/DsrF family protein
MKGLLLVLTGLIPVATYAAVDDGSALYFPQIEHFGGIVRMAEAAEPPRRGAKVVFDITAESKPDEMNKGLESVARYLNLNADVGLTPADVKLAIVLHGAGTIAATRDGVYAKRTGAMKNPNRELIRQLRACGVEVFVCGQSLARNNFVPSDVAEQISIATSAMTVNVNKQQDGYAYLSIH